MDLNAYRPFLLSLYALGILVILSAVLEPIFRFWPPNPGQVGWRFGFVGGAAAAGPGIAFGLAWLLIPALLLGHIRTVRVLSVLSVLAGLTALGITAMFVLDSLQIRATVAAEVRRGFTMTVTRAALVWLLSSPVLLAIGLGGWGTARRRAAAGKARRNRPDQSMLVHPQPKEVG
ncbi:MAG: hypothetical protein ACRELT_00145 [Longimicrobiales bacterium]